MGKPEFKAKLSSLVARVDAELAAVETVASKYEAEKSELQGLEEQYDADMDQQWKDALAQSGVSGSEDKIYSEKEMDEELQPFKDENASLKEQVENLKLELELAQNAPDEEEETEEEVEQVDVEAIKAEAKREGREELRAELAAAYDEDQVAETARETGFRAKYLAPPLPGMPTVPESPSEQAHQQEMEAAEARNEEEGQ